MVGATPRVQLETFNEKGDFSETITAQQQIIERGVSVTCIAFITCAYKASFWGCGLRVGLPLHAASPSKVPRLRSTSRISKAAAVVPD